MNFMGLFDKFTKTANSKQVKALDWALALGSLGYGVYALTTLAPEASKTFPIICIVAGLLGLVLAYKSPSEIIQSYIKGNAIRKKS